MLKGVISLTDSNPQILGLVPSLQCFPNWITVTGQVAPGAPFGGL